MQYRFLSLLSVLLCATQVFAFSNTIYIIREAEKASMGMGGLTPVGRNRASTCLGSYFGVPNGKDIGKIISCRPDPNTGKCDAAFQTVAPLATQLGLKVDVTCTTDETTSIKTCLYEVIKAFVATSTKSVLVVWDIDEMDQVFDNFDFENDDPDFPEVYPDMVATIKNNVFQNFSSELCSTLDGNSGTPLVASTTINPAIPTPTPTLTVAGRRRDFTSQTTTPTPTITFGIEESSSGLASASNTTSLVSSTVITDSQTITSLPTLPPVVSDIPLSIIDPSTTAPVPPIATTGSDAVNSIVQPEAVPIAVDIEVKINVGGDTKHRKGCKYGALFNGTKPASVSTTSVQAVPTTFDLPLETISSSAQASSVSDTSILPPTAVPTLSTITSTSIDSAVTGSTTESATSSIAASTDSAFPIQTPSLLGRMIRRHKRHGALKL